MNLGYATREQETEAMLDQAEDDLEKAQARIADLVVAYDDALDTIAELRAQVEAYKTITYTNYSRVERARVAKDIELILEWAADHPSKFECDCNAYQESDTGAWIHEEDKCSAYIEDHVDIVLRSLVAHFKGEQLPTLPTLNGDLAF